MQLRKLVKEVVRVVSPSPSGADVLRANSGGTPATHADVGLPLAPILDHLPGLDRLTYGPSDDELEYLRSESTVHVPAGVGGAPQARTCRLFFLCGHPRSGTHWMDGIMSRHPRVFMDGEYRFEALRNATDDMTGKPWHAASREPAKAEAERCFGNSVRRILAASAAHRASALWLGDRTPRVLKVFLQGAPHFLIIRDGRDVLVSWAHQEIKNGGYNYRSGRFDGALSQVRSAFLDDPQFFSKNPHELLGHQPFLRQLSTRWRNHTRSDLDALRKIDSRQLGWSARVCVVRYERIHADPEGERDRMYRFLGLDPADALPLDDTSKTQPGLPQENPHALYRKGQVGDWRRYFTPAVTATFKEIVGDTLVELGYERSLDW